MEVEEKLWRGMSSESFIRKDELFSLISDYDFGEFNKFTRKK